MLLQENRDNHSSISVRLLEARIIELEEQLVEYQDFANCVHKMSSAYASYDELENMCLEYDSEDNEPDLKNEVDD